MIPSFLNPLAAEGWLDWLVVVVFYGALFTAVTYRIATANSIFIRRFKTPAGTKVDTRALAHRILGLVSEYEEVHTRGLLTAAGARSGLKNPRLSAEGVGAAAARWYFLEESGVSILYSVFNWLFPVKELTGEISGVKGTYSIRARVERRGAWRTGELAIGEAALNGPVSSFRALDQATVEVTYELLISAARGIGGAERPGTKEWKALRALTQALEAWSRTEDLPDEIADEVEAKLTEALSADPDYPLAHYNRGVFCYREKEGAEANEEAKRHFIVARDAARRRLHEEQSRVAGRADTRLLGLASIGVARTYCQDVHRFGHLQYVPDEQSRPEDPGAPAPWMEARRAAADAVLHLPNDPQAKYAEAFAWHCTVSDGLTVDELEARKRDIEEGKERYESVVSVRRFPGWRKRAAKYAVLHNNLGYILMMGGQVLVDEAAYADEQRSTTVAAERRREAEKWYTKAKRHMETTIEVAPSDAYLKAYAYANLGNLQRLRGQPAEAERSYEAAIEEWSRVRGLHPSDAGPDVYVDGLAERARLFVQAGDRAEDALADHHEALTAAQSPQHRFKIARMFLIACERASRLEPESIESATEWLVADNEPDVDRWMSRMRVLLFGAPSPE